MVLYIGHLYEVQNRNIHPVDGASRDRQGCLNTFLNHDIYGMLMIRVPHSFWSDDKKLLLLANTKSSKNKYYNDAQKKKKNLLS